jgi:hypothetical protein
MRFDLEAFNLAPPSNYSGYYGCETESLTIGNVTICGENTGQHGKIFTLQPFQEKIGQEVIHQCTVEKKHFFAKKSVTFDPVIRFWRAPFKK